LNFNTFYNSGSNPSQTLTSMKTNFKLFLAACALALLSACGNNGAESAATSTSLTSSLKENAPIVLAQSVDAYTPPAGAPATASPMKVRALNAAPAATNIDLGTPLASMTEAANTASSMGKPFQIGFGRDAAQTATAAATSQVLKWQNTASGGYVAAINFSSTGAKGMRIGLLVNQLPASATLRFYAKGATTAQEVKGTEILNILTANLAAGDKTDAGRTYWGPVIDGKDATIEIELPLGVSTTDVSVSIPSVSHMFMSLKEGSNVAPQLGYSQANASLSCQVDVSCTTPLPAASNAVIWLVYINNGGTYICSGTVLNNTANNGIPYVLTANHCISNQTVASTLYSEFNYRSASCNATSGNYFPTTGTSAALLYTAYNTDSTLLRLNGTLPSGVLFAGWDASAVPAVNTTISGIHHPHGDAQRLSRGAVNGYYTRNPDQTQTTSFFGATAANSTILSVNLTTGIVEGGSSGSGLFKGADSNPQLIGQLFGGQAASCLTPTLSNSQSTVYGRFDVAFYGGMSDFLAPGYKPVYRFYNTQKGTHFFTQSAIEKDNVIATLPQFNFEGISFNAYTAPATGVSPVYRFFNTQTGAHFYTISTVERDNVRNTLPQYSYEGERWYAQTASGNGTIPLYRFFHKGNGTHFYTINPIERDNIINGLKIYAYEGIAYHVWP
jgi:lysyl endopeptidase